jgi:preprotein translocase subunit SecD
MASPPRSFNAYLTVALLVLFCGGCQLFKKKEATILRVHLEVNPDGTDKNKPVPVYRQSPVYVNVDDASFLNEGHVEKASVIDALGSFQIMLQLDRQGKWLLEQYSVAHRGRRVAIYTEFGQARWLAAPVLQKRIPDGVLVFTPDATREEAERIVLGLNNVAKRLQKDNF